MTITAVVINWSAVIIYLEGCDRLGNTVLLSFKPRNAELQAAPLCIQRHVLGWLEKMIGTIACTCIVSMLRPSHNLAAISAIEGNSGNVQR